MHSSKVLLYYIYILVQMCAALAAPNLAGLARPREAANGLHVGTPFAKSDANGQLKRRQASKIGLVGYNQRNCSGVLWQSDDLTQHMNLTWIFPNNPIYSFALLHRGLQGQEQLDISTMSNGNPCGNFVDSYFAGTSTSCNVWGNITCFRYWVNPGL